MHAGEGLERASAYNGNWEAGYREKDRAPGKPFSTLLIASSLHGEITWGTCMDPKPEVGSVDVGWRSVFVRFISAPSGL